VYEFLDEIEALPNNNPIAPFQTSEDITEYLREQWAGLFQQFLQTQVHRRELRMVEDLQKTSQTLNQLVTFLTEDRRNDNAVIQNILLTNHPIFREMKTHLRVSFRVFFYNYDELVQLFKALRYDQVNPELWENPDVEEWMKDMGDSLRFIEFPTSMFEPDGRLRIFTEDEWNSSWVKVTHTPKKRQTPPSNFPAEDDFDDSDPFADQ